MILQTRGFGVGTNNLQQPVLLHLFKINGMQERLGSGLGLGLRLGLGLGLALALGAVAKNQHTEYKKG